MEKQYKRTNLLQEKDYNYTLQDVEQPVLYRDMFSYEHVPKIRFNHRVVPMYFPDEIWITDTTFRDGQQARMPFTAEQIVHLYKLMHKLGGPKGIIRQSEFFVPSTIAGISSLNALCSGLPQLRDSSSAKT